MPLKRSTAAQQTTTAQTLLVLGALATASVPELTSAGFETVACSDCDQALEALHTRDFQVLLCDLDPAGCDGIKWIGEVSRLYPQLSIVVVLKARDLRRGMMAMIAGATGYIQSPSEPGVLAATIANTKKRKRIEIFLGNGKARPTPNPFDHIAA